MTYFEKIHNWVDEHYDFVFGVLLGFFGLLCFSIGKTWSAGYVEELKLQNNKLIYQMTTMQKQNANLLDLQGKYEAKFKQIYEVLSFN